MKYRIEQNGRGDWSLRNVDRRGAVVERFPLWGWSLKDVVADVQRRVPAGHRSVISFEHRGDPLEIVAANVEIREVE